MNCVTVTHQCLFVLARNFSATTCKWSPRSLAKALCVQNSTTPYEQLLQLVLLDGAADMKQWPKDSPFVLLALLFRSS